MLAVDHILHLLSLAEQPLRPKYTEPLPSDHVVRSLIVR